jgi:hypothetical protein
VADPVQQATQSNLGQEVPELISTDLLRLVSFESTWEADMLLKLDHTLMRQVKFCEKIAFEKQSIPVNAFHKFSLVTRNTARSHKKELQFGACSAK